MKIQVTIPLPGRKASLYTLHICLLPTVARHMQGVPQTVRIISNKPLGEIHFSREFQKDIFTDISQQLLIRICLNISDKVSQHL